MRATTRALVDLGALRSNVRALAGRTSAEVMAIIKADAYGHGALACGRAAVEAGATRLGVAQVEEAVALRPGLPDVPLFSWMFSPHSDLVPALAAGIELSAGAPCAVELISDAARRAGVRARVHLAFDSGMAREGSRLEAWDDLLAAAARAERLDVAGTWTHFASADEPGNPSNARQIALFGDALDRMGELGIDPGLRHMAASSGLLWHPDAHFDLVRAGIAVYGLAPDGSNPAPLGLTPVMQLEADLIGVKTVPAGTPVSYGGTATVGPTTLGLVPLGYADGIPRQASGNGAWVRVNGRRAPVVGRVCMDQFVVDLGPDADDRPGDTAVVFGAGDGPRADEWARAAGTINYTIVTQIGPRVERLAA